MGVLKTEQSEVSKSSRSPACSESGVEWSLSTGVLKKEREEISESSSCSLASLGGDIERAGSMKESSDEGFGARGRALSAAEILRNADPRGFLGLAVEGVVRRSASEL